MELEVLTAVKETAPDRDLVIDALTLTLERDWQGWEPHGAVFVRQHEYWWSAECSIHRVAPARLTPAASTD